jgi:hypothetical protein
LWAGCCIGYDERVTVTSASRGVWIGLVYALFGMGTTYGALGIRNTAVFGPEIGVLGLALNVVFGVVYRSAFNQHRTWGIEHVAKV